MIPETCTEARACSRCARTIECDNRLPADEDLIICYECYRTLLAPDHSPAVMELFDQSALI